MAKFSPSLFLTATFAKSSSRAFARASKAPARFRLRALAPPLLVLFFLMPCALRSQGHDVLCHEGDGEFEAEFQTGVRVRVGPARNGQLAARLCEASLVWGDQHLVVTSEAAQLDIDAFGVDLGLGAPVVAFQVKKSKAQCCMEYEIYSLRAPPVLLRRLAGGEFFSAADTNLEGRVEIWTDDAASVDGFENLRLRDLDFSPPVVLRFARGRLLDASSEFQPYYDQKIAEERGKLTREDLTEFKKTDGTLASLDIPADRLIHLRGVKAAILEIVWSYLYSGREGEAASSLAEMWPPADFDRVRAAIWNARARGIRSQADGVSTSVHVDTEKHAKIFDGTTYVAPTPGVTPKNLSEKPAITQPRAILMERQPPATLLETEMAQNESLLELVIDCAGKVRSAEPVRNVDWVDEGLLKSASNWKFIPAFNNGQPVASRILLGVSLRK